MHLKTDSHNPLAKAHVSARSPLQLGNHLKLHERHDHDFRDHDHHGHHVCVGREASDGPGKAFGLRVYASQNPTFR